MNYVDYADADFDPLFDRDYYSVSAERDLLIRCRSNETNENHQHDARRVP